MRPIGLCAVMVIPLIAILSCAPDEKHPTNGVTLTLYHWMEKDRALWEEQILKPFEQAHPGVHVELRTSPYNLYVAKCLTSIASGSQLADLMFAEDWFGQELIRKQYARNLMPFVSRDLTAGDFNTETFTEWRGAGQRDDELFGFPASLGLTVLFYNKSMFERAGLAYPDTGWTYEDLVRVGKQLTLDADGDGNPEQWGLSFDVHYTGLETVLYSFGGRTLTADSRHAILTEPATIRGLQFIQDLFVKQRIAPNITSYVNAWDAFAGGRAAMILIGSLGLTSLEGSSLRWDMTLPPKGPGGVRLTRRFTKAFMIPSNSPHPEEAWQLLRWILTQSPVERLNDQYMGMMPTTKKFSSSPAWLDAPPVYDRRLLVRLEAGQSFPLFTPGWQEWRDNGLTPDMMLMIQGKRTAQETAADAERTINIVLDRVFAH